MSGKFDAEAYVQIKNGVKELVGERKLLERQIKEDLEERDRLTKRIEYGGKARTILQLVAQETQSHLEYHISNLVSTALQAVFDDEAPEFIARIAVRRNKTECDLIFSENGDEYKPVTGSGGGALDVASFALRVAYWSLNKNRPVFILDEPFKFVSPTLQIKVSEMVKMVSEKLNIQIIMVSHQNDINYCADKTIEVRKSKGVSKIG